MAGSFVRCRQRRGAIRFSPALRACRVPSRCERSRRVSHPEPHQADAPARLHTTRLAGETSPYLLQHQHNPVDWYPWGPEAFDRARREDKPIFLSVGYSTCYWCHVMERQCFEAEPIAHEMNERFVNIKVRSEEHTSELQS